MRKRLSVLSVIVLWTLLVGISGTNAATIACGDPLDIFGAGGPEFGGVEWGSAANPGVGQHGVCGTSDYFDNVFGGFTVVVTSGLLSPPAPDTFAGFIQVDYSAFAPGDFSDHTFAIPAIPLASSARFTLVTGPGTLSATDDGLGAFEVIWNGTGAALTSSPIVRIEWIGGGTEVVPVPEPASLMLFGTGALALWGRRRR